MLPLGSRLSKSEGDPQAHQASLQSPHQNTRLLTLVHFPTHRTDVFGHNLILGYMLVLSDNILYT